MCELQSLAMKSGYFKMETYSYQILILYEYLRIRTREVSELIILIFNKYFIGFM